jgi:hypothetical protein
VPEAIILAQWGAALLLGLGAAKLLEKWIERTWRGFGRPAQNQVEGRNALKGSQASISSINRR